MGSLPSGLVPLHMAGRAGWLQEWWIVRNVQRLRGESAGAGGVRLPAFDARLDAALAQDARALQGLETALTADEIRRYLQTTLEQTLDLLALCPPDDAALHVYRCALQHEDRLAEAFAVAAQSLGLAALASPGLQQPAPARAPLEPLWMPAQTFGLGSAPGGWVPAAERWSHDEAVPEFEIDAHAVSWQRFVEFAEDGGYDREPLWQPASWQWLQRNVRRAPRHVEQLRGGALVTRFGRLQRAPAAQAVAHVSWHEADAWCRWAGRRLPTELEWELAACTARSRGFCWGDVWEWTAGTARAWPGGEQPVQTTPPRRVLRGASSWTVARAAHPKQRRFAAPERDELFCGFRSSAI
ncbi:MAG: SUMF1/EgtB/PvdO family nonheme iron enzyme [Rubrivivax sp.]|nr:SUMF1/EgtB/PvdO family nonheme iron enzyme [Rubrivivax sp.]